MGLYLNPNADAFTQDINTRIYVDKSLVIDELNKLVCTKDDFVCISRPRRFGKSMAGNMISAYYSKGCNTRDVFSQMKLGQVSNYDRYLNKFNVIKLDLNGWYQNAKVENTVDTLIDEINKYLLKDFRKQFPKIDFADKSSIARCIKEVYMETGEGLLYLLVEIS